MNQNNNPENWSEEELMRNYFDDNPKESDKLMMYQNLMIQMYYAGLR